MYCVYMWRDLRTTVPLVSYIRNSLRFWYYVSLSTCCQNLEKNWGHRENLGEGGGQDFEGSHREKCQFCNRLLLFFVEEDQ